MLCLLLMLQRCLLHDSIFDSLSRSLVFGETSTERETATECESESHKWPERLREFLSTSKGEGIRAPSPL